MTNAIHKALIAAMHDISKIGIAKTKVADQTGGAKYRFRGIEDAMNEMSPILVKHHITITPSYSDLQIVERAKAEGKATRFVVVRGSFKFAAEDGSFVTSECYGEAMDSGDKATTKAQSVAFRTALFQQFIVPTMAMDPEEDGAGEPLPEEAQKAAEQGTLAYQAFWKKLNTDQKRALEPHHAELKAIAAEADTSGK